MSIRLLIGIIVLSVVSVGLVIAGVIIRPAFITLGIGVALLGVWIYLVWTVRKKKTSLFHDRMEPESAERYLKWLRIFLRVAGILLLVGIVGVVVHNVIFALTGIEESVAFFIGLLGLLVFVVATIGGLVTLLIGRRGPSKAIPE
jgi:cytochrome c biogenesis factor